MVDRRKERAALKGLMSVQKIISAVLIVFGSFAFSADCVAQGTQGKGGGRGTAGTGQATTPQVYANLVQLMRGIFYPSSNVIFAAQDQNPDDVKPAKDPSTATNPLESSYGKWVAVENSSLAIAEAANLLILPGRKCSNGLDVPIGNPDWPKFVQGLREAAMASYKAAQTKNQDNIVNAAGDLTQACANCHDKWREKPTLADRCK